MFAPYVAKTKTCSECGSIFMPQRPMARVCSPLCALKTVKTAKIVERKRTRTRKADLETIPDLIKKAQHAFNAYIRERDRDQACICCGKPLHTDSVGGGYDCGHYRSVGSASHLRFDERNAHGQTKRCNRYGAGRAVDYRLGLIGRIGLQAVEALESSNDPRKWERDQLREIRATYQAKLKQLQKERS